MHIRLLTFLPTPFVRLVAQELEEDLAYGSDIALSRIVHRMLFTLAQDRKITYVDVLLPHLPLVFTKDPLYWCPDRCLYSPNCGRCTSRLCLTPTLRFPTTVHSFPITPLTYPRCTGHKTGWGIFKGSMRVDILLAPIPFCRI